MYEENAETCLSLGLTCIHRIPWGGSQSVEYLLKLIQLKYPGFPTRVTSPQCNVSLFHIQFISCADGFLVDPSKLLRILS